MTVRSAAQAAWEGWKRFGRRMGDLQGRLILIIFYFVILAPFAVLLRLAADPLAIKRQAPHGWRPRRAPDGPEPARAVRQY